jgi:endoglucanase
MTAVAVLIRPVRGQIRCLGGWLLALFLAGCGGNDPAPEFTPPTAASGASGGTTQVPPMPLGLQATAGNAQVMLTWTASSGATTYNISRSVMSGGPWIQVATPTTTAYTDTGLTNGVPYYYVVAAVDSAGASANSSQVSATPTAAPSSGMTQVPPTPLGLQATAGNAQVMLTWTASTGATTYNVSRSVTSGGPWIQVATPTTTAYTDTGLTNGVPYYYVVAAIDSAGASADSSQVSATPTAPATGTGTGAGYWHTSGNRILDSNGTPVRIAGINWYGFETPDFLAHGLYAQDYKTILNAIKSLGYNVIRIPFSNELVESNPVPSNFTTYAGGTAANTALVGQSALADLDTIVSYAGSIGLRIILDNHRSEAGHSNEASGLWYTSAYPQENWLADWQTMATRYSSPKFTFNGNPTVIGVDLRNEPHLTGVTSTSGSCWTGDTATNGCPTSLTAQNWPVAAEAAGNAILAINPKLLIFVEGTDCYNSVCGWQGGNLMGVAKNPIVLNVSNQLGYSAHDDGPALFRQSWFNSNTSAASLTSVWNQFWGYISAAGTAPVWLGKFGTDNSNNDVRCTAPGSQGQWFQSLVYYLQNNPAIGWTYWALNGESTYGLLDSQYDATPVNSLKQSLLQSIQFPLTGGTSAPPN